jgi:hypothetical protein
MAEYKPKKKRVLPQRTQKGTKNAEVFHLRPQCGEENGERKAGVVNG